MKRSYLLALDDGDGRIEVDVKSPERMPIMGSSDSTGTLGWCDLIRECVQSIADDFVANGGTEA